MYFVALQNVHQVQYPSLGYCFMDHKDVYKESSGVDVIRPHFSSSELYLILWLYIICVDSTL